MPDQPKNTLQILNIAVLLNFNQIFLEKLLPTTDVYFIDVILPLPLQRLFTYRITEAEAVFLKPGVRVAVPFGKSKIYTGLVAEVHQTKSQQIHAPGGDVWKPVKQSDLDSRYITADILRQIYYNRYITADILRHMY